MSKAVYEGKTASIETAHVTVQALRVGSRQMTKNIYAQLPTHEILQWEDTSRTFVRQWEPWGYINIHGEGDCPARPSEMGKHWHLVGQQGGLLCKGCLKSTPPREARRLHNKAEYECRILDLLQTLQAIEDEHEGIRIDNVDIDGFWATIDNTEEIECAIKRGIGARHAEYLRMRCYAENQREEGRKCVLQERQILRTLGTRLWHSVEQPSVERDTSWGSTLPDWVFTGEDIEARLCRRIQDCHFLARFIQSYEAAVKAIITGLSQLYIAA